MDAKLSAAWAQARVWRAERDEARKMQTNEATGSPPPKSPAGDSISSAWAQARTWRAERDLYRGHLIEAGIPVPTKAT
jgi:hypothetical protein